MQESIPQAQPTREEVAARAYLIWEKNGQVDGQDVQYWLQAEQELASSAKTALPVETSAAPSVAPTPVQTAATPNPEPLPAKAKAGSAKKSKAKAAKG